jgi:hypothetical protein
MKLANGAAFIEIDPTLTQEQFDGEKHQNIYERLDSLSVGHSEIVLLLSSSRRFLY